MLLRFLVVASLLGAVFDAQKPEQDIHLNHAVRDADFLPNKFNTREALRPDTAFNVLFSSDADTAEGVCDFGIGQLWSAEVGSSVFATPLITDLYSDGTKEILTPTFTHHIEALDGRSGEDVAGWPLSHQSIRTHCGILQIDLNHDGISEFLVSTYDGVLVFVNQNGEPIEGKSIALPRYAIREDWADFSRRDSQRSADESPLAVKERQAVRQSKEFASEAPEKPKLHEEPLTLRSTEGQATNPDAPTVPSTQAPTLVSNPGTNAGRKPQFIPDPHHKQGDGTPDQGPREAETERKLQDLGEPAAADDYNGYQHLYDDMYGDDGYYPGNENEEVTVPIGVEAELSAEAKRSMQLLFHPELFESPELGEKDPFSPFRQDPALGDKQILLDVHILASPVVIDLDHDGNLDAVVPVSYFFDDGDVDAGRTIVPAGVDKLNYAASGLVAVDLTTGSVKWSKIMHQTTRTVSRPAYQLSSPILVNVDEDAMLDLVVTSPLGALCIYDWRGVAKKGWPVHMAGFHGGPLVEDVDGDGKVDICAGDLRGNVACYTRLGVEIWERQLDGAISETPTAGDVDGDGYLDIVVGTASSKVYALDGRTGVPKPRFPIAVGPVLAPILLVNLNNTHPPVSDEAALGLHLVFPSLDGYLYVVSGRAPCMQRVDLSEPSYSMILADDVNNDGFLDLVVSALSGTVAVYETQTRFHPLKAWTGRLLSFNGQTAREGHIGVFLNPEFRQPRDVRGSFFQVGFTIEDSRPGKYRSYAPTYFLTVTIGKRLIVLTRLYHNPGTYVERVPAPLERMYATVFVIMMLPDGRFFEDSTAIGFNMHFLETIKWILLVPFLLTSGALMFVRKAHQVDVHPARGGLHQRRPVVVTPFDDEDSDEDSDEEARARFDAWFRHHARQAGV